MTGRPNIVVVMSDNQPPDTLGCYGNAEAYTPHIDALAARGTRFDQAYCVNAMCSPCRASVLTGLMPSQHGVHNWLDDSLSDDWPRDWCAIGEFDSLAQRLRTRGYDTALIGKWHLGRAERPQAGFEHWISMVHGHTTRFEGNLVIESGVEKRVAGHSVPFFAGRAVDYITDPSRRDAPFFAMVTLNGPYGHFPAIDGRGPEPFASHYDDCVFAHIPREPVHSHVIDRFAQRLTAGELREQFKGPLILPNNLPALRNYFAQVSVVDDAVGQIVAALDAAGLAEETIVIFTADHGFSLGHNGVWGHGAAAYPASAHRASYHIPLIAAGGHVARGVCEGMVSQIDLFATICALAGDDGPVPATSDNIAETLCNGRDVSRRAVMIDQEETRALRTQDWLYAARFGDLPDALYDLSADPTEQVDCIDDPACAEALFALRSDWQAMQSDLAGEYDLWHGGTAKSNVASGALWRSAWGADWCPQHPTTA